MSSSGLRQTRSELCLRTTGWKRLRSRSCDVLHVYVQLSGLLTERRERRTVGSCGPVRFKERFLENHQELWEKVLNEEDERSS